MKPELFRDLMDRWYSKQGDLFDFYLNTDSDIQRFLLEALDIEVEANKYPDHESRVLACLRDHAGKCIRLKRKFFINTCCSDFAIVWKY